GWPVGGGRRAPPRPPPPRRSSPSLPPRAGVQAERYPMDFRYDVCVVGGCGHVGLPLAVTFADKGLSVCAYDINEATIAQGRAGRMPFLEEGDEPDLKRVVGKTRGVGSDPQLVTQSRHVIGV